jgi:carbon monoxide dehydrogenase subunit G
MKRLLAVLLVAAFGAFAWFSLPSADRRFPTSRRARGKPVTAEYRMRDEDECAGPSSRRPFFTLAGAAVAWVGLAGAAEPAVEIERRGDAFAVQAVLFVATDRRAAWQVLTDYDNLARFVPDMRSSRIVSAPGEPLLLEQKGESGFLVFKVPVEVVSRITEVPLESIRFQSVGGNLRNKRGEWALAEHDHATRVSYRAEITTGFALPPLIGPAIIGQNVRTMVDGVAREIERRAQSSGAASRREAAPSVRH